MKLPEAFLNAPIAHRGFHDVALGVPENSCASFVAAIEAGFGIEMDIQMTRDGAAMVFHDYDMARLTSVAGPIQQKDQAEVEKLTLIGSEETVPSLRKVLDLVDGRVPLLIEIKDQDGAMGPDVGLLERAVAEDLRGYSGPVALMSFNPHSVAALAGAAPQIPRGITTEAWEDHDTQMIPAARRDELRLIPDFDRVGASFISHQVSDLSRARVRELKDAGVPVLCWTVRSAEQEAEARRIADNITFEGYKAALPG